MNMYATSHARNACAALMLFPAPESLRFDLAIKVMRMDWNVSTLQYASCGSGSSMISRLERKSTGLLGKSSEIGLLLRGACCISIAAVTCRSCRVFGLKARREARQPEGGGWPACQPPTQSATYASHPPSQPPNQPPSQNSRAKHPNANTPNRRHVDTRTFMEEASDKCR